MNVAGYREGRAMAIREARPSDAEGLARVHVATWRSTYRGLIADSYLDGLDVEKGISTWERWVSESGGKRFVLVAEEPTNGIIGFASAGPARTESAEVPGRAYSGEVYAIYVLASHQRRGVGGSLMHEVAAKFLREGVGSMMVWVLSGNPSRLFYEHIGGRECGTQTIAIGGTNLEEVAYGWSDLTQRLDAWASQ